MDRLFVNSAFARLWSRAGVKTVAAAVEKFLPDYGQRQKVTVRRIILGDGNERVDAFFKLYHHREGGWRFWLRRTKSRIEFENYLTFQRLGVPAAEPIACCEERDAFGRAHRDFVITRAVPNARGLDEFFRSRPTRALRQAVADQLADTLRKLHAANFFYYDLVWRNVLVSGSDAPSPKLFLIDCPRGGVRAWSTSRNVLRDLASLDKTAAQLCSRPERLRFFLRYSAEGRLSGATRTAIHACLEYRRKRWPEDWHGK